MTEETSIQKMNLGMAHNFDTDIKPVAWAKIREEIAPQGVKLETNELIDQKFVLLRMKRFNSKFEEQEYAYYVVGTTSDDGELFNTVIGGIQPMEVLDAIYNASLERPIEFILKRHEGGAYGQYYTLE